FIYIFFFQAEDGIRDRNVTGVQTCALPISSLNESRKPLVCRGYRFERRNQVADRRLMKARLFRDVVSVDEVLLRTHERIQIDWRSEESRVGKECRSRWAAEC